MNTTVVPLRQLPPADRIVSVVIGTITAQGELVRRMGLLATVNAGGKEVTGRIVA